MPEGDVDAVVFGKDEKMDTEGLDFVGVYLFTVSGEVIEELVGEVVVHVASGSACVGKKICHHPDGFLACRVFLFRVNSRLGVSLDDCHYHW